MSEKPEKLQIEQDSLEKGFEEEIHAVQASHKYQFDVHDLDRVQRRLKQRHVQMIAIAGTIGTGLFLGSGRALAAAGPLGALIAYALVGTVAYSSLCAVGEMATWAPISGTFPHFAARWVDPALGFAVGWNYFYGNAISIPSEITATVILLTFWDSNTKHIPIYTAVLCVLISLINIFGVRYFGEAEFFFSLIKISLIIGLILAGLVIDLGGGPNHDRIGFRYWKNPGAINTLGLEPNHPTLDRFLAILSVIVQAAFSFQSMELVVIAASETESPRRNIRKAVRRVFYRILIFYLAGILIIGMLVSYDDPNLLQSTGTAAESPFVLAINRAGIKGLPHLINACIFTSALSAGNSYLFASSRVLYGLALRGQAPKFLAYCTKKGLPINAVLFCAMFSLLAFMSVSSGSNLVFNWFVNLSTTSGFTGWLVMNVSYVFFRRGLLAQGFDPKQNAYHNAWQPYVSYWGIFWTTFFILVTGFQVFWSFNASDFFTAYVNIPIFFVLYFGWKITKKTKIWKLHEMDFVTGIPTMEETEIPEVPPKNVLEKIAAVVF